MNSGVEMGPRVCGEMQLQVDSSNENFWYFLMTQEDRMDTVQRPSLVHSIF